ncbi:MAG: hypothetical protein HY556_05830 [Euryarchaeota archaeon]|nr:hypothetical protein [Euryarchaeota archaeon]
MVRIENRVMIEAPVERVWNAVSPPGNLKFLMPGIVDSQAASKPRAGLMKLALTTDDNRHYEAKLVELNPRRDITIKDSDGKQTKWHFEETPRGVLAINIIMGDIPQASIAGLKRASLEKMISLKERVE